MHNFRTQTVVCTFVLAVSCAAREHLSRHYWDYGDAYGPSHWVTWKEKEEVFDSVQINRSQILPDDRSYYSFTGSLTTPPCSEGVSWFVLKHPATISGEEIQRFSQLYPDEARSTQPLYDRVVLESQ